jgi:uncharacterized protein YecT (DUF1311 family)
MYGIQAANSMFKRVSGFSKKLCIGGHRTCQPDFSVYFKLGLLKPLASAMKKLTVPVALALLTLQAFAASFACSKAETYVERTICTDSLLGSLDVALTENYRGMLASNFGGSKKALREKQRRWLIQRNKCTNTKCLTDAYRKRLDETCEYGVVTGVHPLCTLSEEIK